MQRFNPKRVPADFLQALKNTPQIPNKSRTTSKENVMPIAKHVTMPRQIPAKTQTAIKANQNTTQNVQKSSRIKQDDFAKISQSYVLDGNCLKKYETKNMTVISNVRTGRHKQKISSTHSQPSAKTPNVLVSFQQKVKLEYLEEKGFLKPQQKIRLQQARKQKQFPLQPIKGKNPNTRQDQDRQVKKRQYTQPMEMHPYYAQAPVEQEGSDQEEYYPGSHYGNSTHGYPYHYGAVYGHRQPHGAKSQHQQMMSKAANKKMNRGQQAYYRSERGEYHKQVIHPQLRQKEPKIMVTAPKNLQAQYPQPCYQQDYQDSKSHQEEFLNRNGIASDMHFNPYPHHMKPNQNVAENKNFYDNKYFYPPHYRQSAKQKRFEQRSEPKKQVSHLYAGKERQANAKRFEEPYGCPKYHSYNKNYSTFYQNPDHYRYY